MKECLSPLPGAPNVGEWFVLRKVPSKKVRTLGARGLLATPLERTSGNLAKHDNGDTESLPRFMPPYGVTPYSCFSNGLHCGSYSTRVSSSSSAMVDGGMDFAGGPLSMVTKDPFI